MLKHSEQPDGRSPSIDDDFKTIARAAELIIESGLLAANQLGADNDPTCCNCNRTVCVLYPEIKQVQACQQEILNYILEKQEAETVYLDAEKTRDRIGISDSTLLRCQRRGEIAVAKMLKGKKFFRERDVERLKKEYWGLD